MEEKQDKIIDFYEILGITKDATQHQIKKAYKLKAKENHPDKGGDAELFKIILEAYQTLSNSNMRAIYDECGKSGNGNEFEQIKNIASDKFFSLIEKVGLNQALTVNIFNELINDIYRDISKIKNSMQNNSNGVKLYKRMIKRVSGEDEFFIKKIEDRIESLESMNAQNKLKIEFNEKLIKFIENYNFSEMSEEELLFGDSNFILGESIL